MTPNTRRKDETFAMYKARMRKDTIAKKKPSYTYVYENIKGMPPFYNKNKGYR